MSLATSYSPSANSSSAHFLLPENLADLRNSGLSDATIAAAGIHSVFSPCDTIRLLGWHPSQGVPAIVFPYLDLNGQYVGYSRMKPSTPLIGADGRPMKYLAPRGLANRLYVPPGLLQLLVPSGLLIVTEGEKKALCATQFGFPAVAISGVWCFRSKEKRLIDDFFQLPLTELRIFICFDSDAATNLDVTKAETELANELTLIGARVQIIRLPPAVDGSKQGLDDFICRGASTNGELQRVMYEAQRWRFEVSDPPDGPFIELETYRERMEAARLANWPFRNPKLDTSVPGSGKSHADRKLMIGANRTLTVVPTHRNAQDLETELRRDGFDATAYPDLTEDNCQNLDEAKRARGLSLPFPSAICCQCPHRADCEDDGYLSQVVEAERSQHALCTQERFCRIPERVAEKRDVLFFHEEVEQAFLRAEAISRDCTSDLIDIFHFASNAARSHGETAEAEFFTKLWRTACDAVLFAVYSPVVAPIPVTSVGQPSSRWSRSLFQKIEHYRQRPGKQKMKIDGTAIRAIVDAVQGKCQLFTRPKRETSKQNRETDEIIGVWKTALPPVSDVWLEDGSADPESVRDALSPVGVIDATPSGRLRREKLVIQIPCMIRKGTRPLVVQALVRGILAHLPDDCPVGIIVNKKHKAAVRRLRREFPNQRLRISHYRSGEDTGSNGWLDCKVLLIVGTPYVPPRAIQKELIRQGNIDAANRDGRWGDRYWHGRSLSGEERLIRSRGYHDPDWHQAHRAVVRSKLHQGTERSRSHLPKGVPLTLVVSKEPLELPLAEIASWRGMTKTEARLFRALCASAKAAGLSSWGGGKDADEISARSCIYDPIQEVADILSEALGGTLPAGEMPERGISTADLVEQLNLSETTVRYQLRRMAEKGFVVRFGNKGALPVLYS